MILVNPAYEGITEDWFVPHWWKNGKAQSVMEGGRGSAWFVNSSLGDLVLRHYRRGGLVAKLSQDRYVYCGNARARSVREFRVLTMLHKMGLPVPEPIAARVVRHGICYEADILIRRLSDAVPLPEVHDLINGQLWQSVGETIRRFHDVGLNHVDLNCDNILIGQERVYLIDFDRCFFERQRLAADSWKKRNLARLRRSVEKRLVSVCAETRHHLWCHLEIGYRNRSAKTA